MRDAFSEKWCQMVGRYRDGNGGHKVSEANCLLLVVLLTRGTIDLRFLNILTMISVKISYIVWSYSFNLYYQCTMLLMRTE